MSVYTCGVQGTHHIPFNSMADAAAKASLTKDPADVTPWIAKVVRTRPILYVRYDDDNGMWSLRNGTVRREMVETIAPWIHAQLMRHERDGLSGWSEVMRRVAEARGKRVSQEEKNEIDAERWNNQHQARVGRQVVTHCMRANDSRMVEQGVGWARRVRSAKERDVESKETIEHERGCAVCGVKHCDLAHVVLARCAGVEAATMVLITCDG